MATVQSLSRRRAAGAPGELDGEATRRWTQSFMGAVNVRDFAADPNTAGSGTSDDTAAIEAAIAAALAMPGGRVIFPSGTWGTTRPIEHPETVGVEGTGGQRINYTGAASPTSVVKALPTHTGVALWRLRGKAETGRTSDHVGASIRRLAFDGSQAPAGTKGIVLAGLVRETLLEDVTVFDAPDTGVWCGAGTTDTTKFPQSFRFTRCVADSAGGAGFSFSNTTDATLEDCLTLGAGYVGFYLAGFQHGILLGCRAEWSAQQGFLITSGYWGTGPGAGGAHLVGCSTDRSGYDGVRIDVSGGSAPVQITGFEARRDGRNGNAGGGGYAGVRVASAVCPVTIDNLVVYPGVDDTAANNTTGASPQYGVSSSGATGPVRVNSGALHALTSPVFDGGTNTGGFIVDPAVQLTVGNTATFTRIPSAGPPGAVSDAQWYGDLFATMDRGQATSVRATTIGTTLLAIGRAQRTFIARAVRLFNSTAAGGTTAGTLAITVATGDALTAMTVQATYTTASGALAAALLEYALSASFQVRTGQFVAIFAYPQTYSPAPGFQALGGSGGPAGLISPTTATMKAGSKAAAPPTGTFDLTAAAYTASGQPLWAALIP